MAEKKIPNFARHVGTIHMNSLQPQFMKQTPSLI